ncbi:MAG TPA: tRNA (N6-isopentenyl adenosine(37)-C2)-methylthiotransferase MiaB, partial [Thermodesulfobacteriota bacterium]|nr:tRNA (N6-isopentenyl adenosine(37)-C2)-methylthiotransferase MiaB [Thermodesulfobacteriota bacterium]
MISKKFFIQTFGCQMNVYDSSRVAGILAGLGYHAVEDPKEADLILVNTCSVREKPETKVYSALGRFQPLKKRNPALLIGVLGCVAQQEGDRLFSRVPFLDFVVGTKEMGKIPEILESLRTSRKPRSETGMARIDAYAGLPVLAPVCPSRSPTAFVSIMQGCDNFCSFCVVPFVRGREMSRPAGDILREIRALSE